MVDRPIIFSGPMVRALLAGRKTQTRRLAKFIEPRGEQFHVHSKAGGWFGPEARVAEVAPEHARYAKGDRLYVREGYRPFPPDDKKHPDRWGLAYAATGGVDHFVEAPADFGPTLYNYDRWTPSIHMPRWASRLTLIVEDVRVERLQAISEDDAWAEGVCAAAEDAERQNGKPAWGDIPRHYRRLIVDQTFGSAPTAFHWLWSGLHDKPGQRWEDNPFVVALTFRVEHGNIDRLARVE